MLDQYVEQFQSYCQIAFFSELSLRILIARLKGFNVFIKSKRLKSPKEIIHLMDFLSDFKLPSVYVKKSRVRAVKKSSHLLVLNQSVSKDIARDLSYSKIERMVPK